MENLCLAIKTKRKMKKRKNNFLFIASFLFSVLFSVANFSANAQEAAIAGVSNANANQVENLDLTFDKVDSSRFYGKASLQLLNKTTAKSSVAEVPIGGSIQLGQLTIKVDKCWQAPLDQKPDSRVLLEVFETKSGEQKRIFYGWMISSSPSVSSLEHPIYDVTALSCKNK